MKLLRFACLFLGAVAVFDGASGAVVRQDNSQVPGIMRLETAVCASMDRAPISCNCSVRLTLLRIFHDESAGRLPGRSATRASDGVWHSLITDGGAEVARQTDFVTVGSDGFVRRIHAQRPFSYRITVRMEDRYAPYEELINGQGGYVGRGIKECEPALPDRHRSRRSFLQQL